VLLLLPLAKDLLGPAGFSRAAGVGLFADPGPINRINEQRGEHADFKSLAAKLIHNKFVNYGLAFLENWASHFHGEFLFLSGDAVQRDKVPETGQLYLFDLLWLIIGGWWLVKSGGKSAKIIFFWLAVAPIASALTFQSPSALRAQNMVIPPTLLSAVGLTCLIIWLQQRKLLVGIALLFVLISWQFARYEHLYWVHLAKEYSFSSQYGVKELVTYLKRTENSQRQIYVTMKYDQPYILFLFYLKYQPATFQKEQILTVRDGYGFSTVANFANFHFGNFDSADIKTTPPGALFALAPD